MLNKYSYSELYKIVTVIHDLDNNGISFSDLECYVNSKQEAQRNAIINQFKNAKKCSECGNMMMRIPLNIPKGRSNIFGYNFVNRCPSCFNEIFEG